MELLTVIKKPLSICLFILTGLATSAQIKSVDNIESRKFFFEVHHTMLLDENADSVCNEYSTITIHVRNNKILDSVDFTGNPKAIKIAFIRALPLYKKANWKKIIRNSGANFDILQPFSYHYYPNIIANCPDPLPANQIKEMMDADIRSRKSKKIPTYLLELLNVRLYAPVSKK
ncbi:hypothetical protein CLV51_103304 [Chitinophaga niastensis]|uniref:Uncharacterized protein n=1 Tax=Chitinophaga niastensis TaxID=536980 RepID=A0A2P8HJD0_CHINA|nr:hypothetical protein [Chitinophaga niastensis]PSL46326.1 hypothetical protein CLV51_103304 [Chitinophaga niastensis]